MTTTRLSPGDRARWEATCSEIAGFGVSRDRIKLLAFQVRGQSKSPLPDWRLFDVARMERLVVLDETFRGSRERSGQSHKQWNLLLCRVE